MGPLIFQVGTNTITFHIVISKTFVIMCSFNANVLQPLHVTSQIKAKKLFDYKVGCSEHIFRILTLAIFKEISLICLIFDFTANALLCYYQGSYAS